MRKPKQVLKDWAAARRFGSQAQRLGLRYRLNNRHMVGEPHFIFPSRKMIAYVCSCRALGHSCDLGAETAYGVFGNRQALDIFHHVWSSRGWRVEVIWTCETLTEDVLHARVSTMTLPKMIS